MTSVSADKSISCISVSFDCEKADALLDALENVEEDVAELEDADELAQDAPDEAEELADADAAKAF